MNFRYLLMISCGVIMFLSSCKKKFEATHHTSEEIGRYIAARIPSVIDVNDPVRIRFAVQPDTSQTSSVFEFSPDIKGRAYWEDNMTFAFIPTNGWKPGQSYQLQVNLDKIFKDVDADMKRVVFSFDVKPLRMNVSFEPLVPGFDGDKTNYLLRGRINTSAPIDSNQIRKIFGIKGTGEIGRTEWFHSAEGKVHEWVISEISPDSKIDFRWDGESIGSTDTGKRTIVMPRADELSVLSYVPGNDGEKKIEVHFSQKLDPNQDLAGFVTINGTTNGFTVRKQDHILTIYPDESLTGKLAIQLHPEISSSRGHKLGKATSTEMSLEDSKPALRLVGSGVIVPGNAEVIFPFEAINLKTVQVEVMRVFENNILQYLQQSGLEDQWGLEPVGRIILQKTIDLEAMSDRDNRFIWTRYALDLGPLVELAPGSIYQVRIGFTGADTYLDCYQEMEFEKPKPAYGEVASMWEYRYNYGTFRWEQTEDPCYPAFYNPEKYISRNLLASDIGLTAKQNDEGKLWVFTSSLGTVEPKSGIDIEIYDYQQQLMTKTKTSSNGEVAVEIPRKAFFIVATEGDQKGYLRMADGLSMSLSEFDVSGTGYQQGLRGYLYAERDVWRPGDTVHLNFILWDPEGKIDDRHPVKLTVTNPLGQKKIEKTSPLSVGGIYDLAFQTSATDPTGTWMTKVQVGDAVFTKALRIETIKPNRLKIDAKLPKEIIATAPDQKIELDVTWLFGAPASNLKANVEAQFTPLPFSPTGFKEFTFTDPARFTANTVTTVFDGPLDAQGKASIKIPEIKDALPEGQLTMSLKTRVFETGGDFSTDRHSTTYHPYDHYAGVSVPVNRWGYEELMMNQSNDI